MPEALAHLYHDVSAEHASHVLAHQLSLDALVVAYWVLGKRYHHYGNCLTFTVT